jgi:hypothetical protein
LEGISGASDEQPSTDHLFPKPDRGYQMMATYFIRKVPIASLQGAPPLEVFVVTVETGAKLA